jgi:hypothetical protein
MLERTLKWLKRAETAGEIVHAGYDAFEKSRPVLEALVSTPQS